MKTGIVFFTQKGRALMEKVTSSQEHDFIIYDKNESALPVWVKDRFKDCGALLFIGAAGIAVRLIAPHIRRKDKDPAVLVMDDGGNNVIPVLSGHIGGANKLAVSIADIVGANTVITTSTDIHGAFAVDLWCVENNCTIDDISKIKFVSSALLAGEKVYFKSSFPVEGGLPEGVYHGEGGVGINVSFNPTENLFKKTLNIIPKICVLGCGCRKNTDSAVFEKTVMDFLQMNNISVKALKAVSSITLKAEEKAVLDFTEKYELPFLTYTAEELRSVKGDFSGSSFVASVTGVDNICERSAVMAADSGLTVKKYSINGITCALAIEEFVCRF